MNNNPRIAAAAINTALFHIGTKPRRTPEKMNPGSVARRGSKATTFSCFASALRLTASLATSFSYGDAAVSLCDSGTASRSEVSSDTVFVAVSGTTFRSAVIASLEPVSEIETF